jgi:hypothetical protein
MTSTGAVNNELESSSRQGVDLEELHEGLGTVEGVMAQEALKTALLGSSPHVPANARSAFQRIPARSCALSTMKTIANDCNVMSAMSYLFSRTKIDVDDRLVVKREEDRVLYSTSGHRIDFYLFVPKQRGLHAIIPTITADHSYTFVLTSSQQQRSFKLKHGRLGFDPAGRMLYIGTCNNDEVWLAMAPKTAESGVGDHFGPPSGATQLSRPHYRMVLMFLARCMSKLERNSVWLADPENKHYYNISLTDEQPQFEKYTDFR